ncbi:structural maintenance of chromosomes protein 5-like [Diadema antillarum]|uniref:structural maintenance of chromosomes protein 5-like n=1 Tax=Diadema antillarum TaxID=105358 RepID=UPI003A865813
MSQQAILKRKKAAAPALGRQDNMKGFIKGSIIRIKMENFMTYDSCEVYPGPHLNMIMGPNTTGKSTIVCALCLALNGSTNLLARAKDIGEYVRWGTNKAEIELELYNPGDRNFVLQRTIMRQGNQSHFYMNNMGRTGKQVTEFAAKMNIQIGNLCQFLPQEKVSEFAQMNHIELLEKTEQAVGDADLYKDHQTLKERHSNEKELQQQLKNKQDRLGRLRQENSRFERDVERFREREKTLEEIETMEKKKAWLLYDEKRQIFEACKKEKKSLEKLVMERERRAQPLEAKLKGMLKKLSALEDQRKAVASDCSKQESIITRKQRELGNLAEEITKVQEELRAKKAQEQERASKIHEWKKEVQGWKNKLETLEPDDNIKPQLAANMAELNRVTQETTQISTKCSNIKVERDNIKGEIGALNKRLKQVNDLRDQRLRLLRNKFPDTVNAVMWLRSNRDQFKKPIHEPIALVLKIGDKDYAKYVERSIPSQDLLAFVCEDADDQDKFITEVRDKQGLRVNVVKSPAEPLSSFNPPKPIQQQGFGFQCYLKDLVTAPDAVMAYLCKLHKLHLIPLGNDDTERNVDRVIEHSGLRSFYTPGYHYSVKQSRYGDRIKSSLSSQVREAKLLGVSNIDMNEKRDLEAQIQAKERDMQAAKTEFEDYEKQHLQCTKRINELKDIRTNLNRSKNQRRTIQQNINTKLELIRKREAQAVDLEQAKLEANQSIQRFNNQKLTIIKKICELNKSCLHFAMRKVSLFFQHEVCNRAKVELEAKINEDKSEEQQLLGKLQEVQESLDQVKKEARALLGEARRKTGSESPSDPLRKLFEQYTNNLDELESQIHMKQTQADLQYPTDRRVVMDYEKRKKEIRTVEAEVAADQNVLQEHATRITSLKETWLERLNDHIAKINSKFSLFFSKMGCAGEVALYTPDEESYDKYGIHIKVKFRANERLQLLTATYQSGGERSVATILYLMALQDLNKCPFRVVDEINQGMDPSNERKVFEFVVETACRENTSQYFLITPKLLLNLKYGPKMKVLCVYNSHWMLPYKKWDIDRFISIKENMN